MRARHFVVAAVAVAAAGLLAASGLARTDAPGWNNPVRITNTSCDIGYTVVDAQYKTIVFGIFNGGTVAHGFDIGGPYSVRIGSAGPREDTRDPLPPRCLEVRVCRAALDREVGCAHDSLVGERRGRRQRPTQGWVGNSRRRVPPGRGCAGGWRG